MSWIASDRLPGRVPAGACVIHGTLGGTARHLQFAPDWARLVTQSGMEETMAARSVGWDTGEVIPGTPFRHMIKAADTGSRFSAQLAVVKVGELPHFPRDEGEFSFVFRGRIGGRVATTTWWLR